MKTSLDTTNSNIWHSFLLPKAANRILKWHVPDSEEVYQNLPKPIWTKYDETSIEYRTNSYGYRCDEFVNNDIPKVMFIGCSMTMGIGMPLEHTWAYKTWQKICTETGLDIPYYNLAHGGKSSDYVARTVTTSIDTLKPRIIIALLPDLFRHERYINGVLRNLLSNNAEEMGKKVYESLMYVHSPLQNMYDFTKNIALIESTCSNRNVEFLWDNWAFDSFTQTSFKRMSGGKFEKNWMKTEIPFFHKDDGEMARDGIHPAESWHDLYVDRFWVKYKDRILESLG